MSNKDKELLEQIREVCEGVRLLGLYAFNAYITKEEQKAGAHAETSV